MKIKKIDIRAVAPAELMKTLYVIARAEVEHSILLVRSSVRHLDGRMESSLLGRDVRIGRDDRQPRAYRFMVGDNSEIGIL
jgi:glucose-1-phosphate thymidylyltransferase